MPNKYANLTGTNRISDEYSLINDGFDSVQTDVQALETKANAAATHAADKQNPHNTSKTQVGLGSVDNYATANQTQAQAGTATNAFMTPQRTKQAIEALAPATAPVQSVAGRTGAVTLTTDDVAETAAKKIMTNTERTKLTGITAGAEPNQNAYSSINGIAADAKQTAVTFKGGTGITVTQNASTKEVTITSTGESTPGSHASSHVTGGSDPIPVATTSANGLMTKEQVAELGNKLDKANPAMTGTLSIDGLYSKFLGQKTTIASSANQRMDIILPKVGQAGYFDITLTGGFANRNLAGKMTKRFVASYNSTGTIHHNSSKYIEVTGGAGMYLRIGEFRFDSTLDKYVVSVYFSETTPSDLLEVYIEGIKLTGAVETILNGIILSNFVADGTVLPAPKIQIDTELHNGWRRYNNYTDLGLSYSATMQQIFDAMTSNSIAIITVDTSNQAALDITTWFGVIIIEKIGTSRASAKFEAINAGGISAIGRFSNTGAWLGWRSIGLADGALQTNLNADMVDSFHASTIAGVNTVAVRDANGDIKGRRFFSNMATGFSPFVVESTTLVNNLNAERTNGIKTFNSLTTPVGASNGDLWFPPPS